MNETQKRKRLLKKLRDEMPLNISEADLTNKRIGLVIVDMVNGFCEPGAGNLAPPAEDPVIEKIITRINSLSWYFIHKLRRPILLFTDAHDPGKPEPPYSRHCEKGSGEEELIDELEWLENRPDLATVVHKDCLNGYVGATDKEDGKNKLLEWIKKHQIETLVFSGVCTDICVMQLVQTVLSARNHGLAPGLRDIIVCANCCATYDLSKETALALGLPETDAHPREFAHHMGLYFMAKSGALLANAIKIGQYKFFV